MAKLSNEEIECFNMWINKRNGINPNQYHYFYEQGDTMIYPEHIADLSTLDSILADKEKHERFKKESKDPKNNPLKQGKPISGAKGNKGAGFYNTTFKYRK
ncbi:MAG: hypothetical protein ACPKPY_10895 [Nitrososphaeraceae archaeon]